MNNHPPRPPPPARRRRLRIVLAFAVFALAVVVAAYFLGRERIGESVARKVGERLAEDGVFIAWQSADWLPGEGVRLHGLALYRDPAKHERLALFGMVTVGRTDRSQLRWDRASFYAADTQLLLGTGEAEMRLDHTDMILHIEPGKANLPECHANLQGLRIEAKCAFVASAHAGNAEAVAAARKVTQREGLFRDVNLDWLTSVKEDLKFQAEKDDPTLRIELHSLPDDRGMESTMTFDGTNFQWRGVRWDFVQADIKIPVGKKNASSPIEIDHVRIGHAGRKAEMAGAFDPTSRVIRVSKLDSGIDLLALTRALLPDAVAGLSAASASGVWWISGAGEIPVDRLENSSWNGDVALGGDFVYTSGETNILLQKPEFAVRLAKQVVSIAAFQAGLWGGRLDVPAMQVHLPLGEKQLRFETQLMLSGAQPQSISDSFNAGRKQTGTVPLNWKGAWRVNAAGEIPLDHLGSFHWRGDMALDGDLVYESGETSVTLKQPTFSMRMEKEVVSILALKAGLWEGNLNVPKMEIFLPSTEKKLRFETQLILSGARSRSISDSFKVGRKQTGVPLDWKGAWRVNAAGEIPLDRLEGFQWRGDMALDGDLVYASGETSVTLKQPIFSMRMEKEVVSISALKAGLWEGSLNVPKMKIFLPSTEKKLRFETQLILSGARPSAVRKSFTAGQKQPRVVRLYSKGDWRISTEGEIPLGHPEDFRWNGNMTLDGDLVYASGETNVTLRQPTFSVRMEKRVVSISALKAGLWEGSLNVPKMKIFLPLATKKPRFEMQITLKGARLQSIINSFGGAQTAPGIVQIDWQGGGEFEAASLTGSGALNIGEAEFGRMPILGPLHSVFDILAPGFRKDEPSTMTVKHRVLGGTLFLDDLKLTSQQVRVEADGEIDLAREYAQFTAKGRLRRLPGLATVLLTFLLEFKGEGPVDDVRWRLKSLPRFHLISKIAKRAKRTEAEKAADRALKGLLELPGNVLEEK